MAHPANHIFDEGRLVSAVLETFITERLGSHLFDSLLSEQGERFTDCRGCDSVAFEADLLH